MTGTIEKGKTNVCEKLSGYILLSVAGGICGGYGVISCGHTFPLAQTGNLIGMWEVLVGGDWRTALLHFLMLVLSSLAFRRRCCCRINWRKPAGRSFSTP